MKKGPSGFQEYYDTKPQGKPIYDPLEEVLKLESVVDQLAGLANILLYRIDRLTNGFVIDERERNKAIEDYKNVRDALSRLRTPVQQAGAQNGE